MTLQPRRKLLAVLALAVTVVAATATISTLAAISSSKNIQSNGKVKTVNVGVYWDDRSIDPNVTSTVNWGTLSPGASSSVVLYVRNEGTVTIKLSLTTQNWNPLNAYNYIALAWNRQGQTVNAGSSVQATLTLSVFSNATGITDFSFDIIISGVEQ